MKKLASKGGYVLQEAEDADITIVSTGSEVGIVVDAKKVLAEKNIKTRIVSLPDFHTFGKQSKEYQLSVLPDGVPILSVEVLATSGWAKYAHQSFGLDRFGASGKGPDVYKFFEFTPEGIATRAEKTVEFYKGKQVISPLNTAF